MINRELKFVKFPDPHTSLVNEIKLIKGVGCRSINSHSRVEREKKAGEEENEL